MELERRLRKVAGYHLALFLLPVLSLLYYGWWAAGALDQRPDNPLRLSPMALRGDIDSRDGSPLAHSDGEARTYPLGAATGPLVGYHLRGRNQSGLEALLQASLSPPAPPKSLWGALAQDRARASGQAPLRGPDVTLTIDAKLQRELYLAFTPLAGAVVVADLDNGEILAAVSTPSFDPGLIAKDFQELRNDPGSPLIERVGGGLYPVQTLQGSSLLTPEQAKNHPWLGDNPFPLFPGASSALAIEGRLLLSPLMLLQIAAQRESFVPRLTLAASQPPEGAAVAALIPPAGSSTDRDGLTVWSLLGPKFEESPPFLVLLGRREGGTRPLAFVVVVESNGPLDSSQVQQLLWPILRRY